MNLVERLRDDGELINKLAQEAGWNSCHEAADEIERLRAALQDKFIAGYQACYERKVDEGCYEYKESVIAEAKAALDEYY